MIAHISVRLTIMHRWIALGVLGLCVTACSHAPDASDIPPSVSFTTKILGDDTKLFTYTLHRGRSGPGEDDDILDASRGGDMRGGGPRRDAPSSKTMLRGVEAILGQNNYCRSGYMVLEQYEQQRNYIVRGECRDGATREDREKFLH